MIYAATNKSLALTSGVAQRITLPSGSKEHLLTLSSDVEWQFAFSQAAIDADEGIPMKAGSSYTIDSAIAKTDMWIKQSSGSSVDLRWAYLYIARR